MKNPSIELIRTDFIEKRLQLQKDQPQFLLSLDSINKNILFALQDFENHTSKQLRQIGFYWPIRGEPSITSTLLEWKKGDPLRKLALPVCRQGQILAFHEWDSHSLMTNGFANIPEPTGTPVLDVDLLLIPCVGWQKDRSKIWRLGYGGGFYDRTIEHWLALGRRPVCIGIGFEFSQLTPTDWTPQSHDYPLDGVVTESGWLLAS